MNKDEDMSNTFVAEVGQKSAIFKIDDDDEIIDTLEDEKEERVEFPDITVELPTKLPSVFEGESKNDSSEEKIKNDEGLGSKKQKHSKNNKKRNPFVIILIIIVCLALGAFGSYYYFEIYQENDNTNKEEVLEPVVEVEELQPDSIFVKQLVDKYDIVDDVTGVCTYKELYLKDKSLVSEMNNNYLKYVAANNVSHNLYSKRGLVEERFNDSFKEMFGSKINLEAGDIYYPCMENQVLVMKYDKENKIYDLVSLKNTDKKEANTVFIKKKIVKANKNKDKLSINVAVSVDDGNKIYKGFDGVKPTGEIVNITYETFDIEKDYTKLNQYKYNFNYDNLNQIYYLDSVELVK